jgi:hypothetical protein
MKYFPAFLMLPLFFTACGQEEVNSNTTATVEKAIPATDSIVIEEQEELLLEPTDNRIEIIKKIKSKIENNIPLVVHVNVPLCDNENQGIVPTSPSLGNGMDLKRNLYWATSKGMKRFFKELSDWKLLSSELESNEDVLERVVFKKKFSNGAIVYLVADAYRGDRMVRCLQDHFNALSGVLKDTLIINSDTIGIYGNADLLAFNGHNGLMDETVFFDKSVDGIARDAVTIACISGDYFKTRYQATNSYPLVHTTNLLYPGAFILEGVINSWANLESDKECKIAAGKGYYKHKPKSGPNGSQNLFSFGW